MKVREVMEQPITVNADTTIHKVREIFLTTNIWAIYVVGDQGNPIGVITRQDYHRRMRSSIIMACDIMSPQPYTIVVNADISTALTRMYELQIGTLAVMDNGKFCGVVNRKSIEERWEVLKPDKAAKSWRWTAVKIFFAIGIVAIFVVYFSPVYMNLLGYKKCSDNSFDGWCSTNKPFYCNNGTLIYSPLKCGCPSDQIIDNAVCRKYRNCSDGTSHNNCSINKPLFCNDGNLTLKASVCGCPNAYLMEEDNCRFEIDCSDGTKDTQCSQNQPYKCYNGTLFENAKVCGCPYGDTINADSCESWGDNFFSAAAKERGSPYKYCPTYSDFAKLRFSTMSNNYEISHYGHDSDSIHFFGTIYTGMGEEVLFPSGYSANAYVENLQETAPLHWEELANTQFSYYGFYYAPGPAYGIYQPCPTTEIPGPNINVSQFYDSMGCSYTVGQSDWFVVEIGMSCPG